MGRAGREGRERGVGEDREEVNGKWSEGGVGRWGGGAGGGEGTKGIRGN